MSPKPQRVSHEPDIFLSLERDNGGTDGTALKVISPILSRYRAIHPSIDRALLSLSLTRFAYATSEFTREGADVRTSERRRQRHRGRMRRCGGGDPETANNAHDNEDGPHCMNTDKWGLETKWRNRLDRPHVDICVVKRRSVKRRSLCLWAMLLGWAFFRGSHVTINLISSFR